MSHWSPLSHVPWAPGPTPGGFPSPAVLVKVIPSTLSKPMSIFCPHPTPLYMKGFLSRLPRHKISWSSFYLRPLTHSQPTLERTFLLNPTSSIPTSIFRPLLSSVNTLSFDDLVTPSSDGGQDFHLQDGHWYGTLTCPCGWLRDHSNPSAPNAHLRTWDHHPCLHSAESLQNQMIPSNL